MSGILNTTGAVSGILGKSVLPAGVTGGSGLTTVNAANIASGVLPVGVTGGSGLDASPLNGRNMIINGGMQVWQRATATTAVVNDTYSTVDRWKFWESSEGAYTSEKHAMSLAEINTTGHSQAIALNVTTADGTIAAGQYAFIEHMIEAQNCQHLQWGTAAAKDVTLSFWVKSKIAGTYCVGLDKMDSTAYYMNREYTINDADTWEYKTITITPTAGSTTLITGAGGIIVNDSGIGMELRFGLAWGTTYHATTNTWATGDDFSSDQQVNWMSSTSNDFYLTGVQLEAGSVATPFEHRSYGDELAKCMRYYFRNTGGDTFIAGQLIPSTTTAALGYSIMPVSLRSTSITLSSGSIAATRVDDAATVTGLTYQSGRSTNTTIGYDVAGSSFIADTQYFLTGNGSGAYIAFDAEI